MQLTSSSNGRGRGPSNLDALQATFIRNVEHELRTPLTLLQGYAELLCNDDLDTLKPHQQQAIRIIASRADQLRTLVERIGILLATETGAFVSMPFRLTEIVRDLIEARGPHATQAGLTLELRMAPDIPDILGDPYHLRQAIDCLVENAIKFTASGGRVEVQVDTQPGWLCLSVSDTGIGIDAGQLANLYTQSFYQVDDSTTRHHGGIGLGLTVVKAVIEAHKGQIDMKSQLEQGSQFSIRLPVQSSEAERDQPAQDKDRRQRILIVDDDKHVASTLQRGLKRLPNCDSIAVTDAQQALELFAQQPFDLLITDYKMPGMDGVTLAGHVRRSYPQTIIVVITAYGDKLLSERVNDISIHRVLDKPIKLKDIRNVALEALGKDSQPKDSSNVA